ncbi:hypothetical protein PspLS_05906 [Pyricularia sp. CBS 133598]|nr:hypothetical protein PspLS_05906 [Pyricularia sp. CBS 133598]
MSKILPAFPVAVSAEMEILSLLLLQATGLTRRRKLSKHGAKDTSKQVYDPLSAHTQPLALDHDPPKDRSNEAPEAALPPHIYGVGSSPGQEHQFYSQQFYPQHQYHRQQDYASLPSFPPGAAPTGSTTGSEPKASDEKPGRSRPSGLVAILIAVLSALVAATISGVAVWKLTEVQKSSTTEPTSPNSPTTPTVGEGGAVACPAIAGTTVGGATKVVRSNLALAAVGLRVRDEYYIQLAYQDPNDNLMTSWFSSLWEAGPAYGAQHNFNYFSPNGTVLGYNFASAWQLGLPDDIVSQQGFIALANSSFTSLWPLTYYQTNEAIMEVDYAGAGISSKTLPGLSNAAKGSPLLALPVGATHNFYELRLSYRDTDGKLAVFERDSHGTMTDNTGALGVNVPADAGLGGFATARQALLWQDVLHKDENGGIRFLSQTDGDKEWKGPASNPVFSGADVPTHVTCVKEGMGVKGLSKQHVIPLPNKRDLNRCYYQADGGKLKQVWHDGTRWVDLGYVLMP